MEKKDEKEEHEEPKKTKTFGDPICEVSEW